MRTALLILVLATGSAYATDYGPVQQGLGPAGQAQYVQPRQVAPMSLDTFRLQRQATETAKAQQRAAEAVEAAAKAAAKAQMDYYNSLNTSPPKPKRP